MYSSKSEKHCELRIESNITLIWLDADLSDTNPQWQGIISRFQSLVNSIATFTDADSCVDFLSDLTDENVFMVMSSTFAEKLLLLIHSIPQLSLVYILDQCATQTTVQTSEWPKAKDVLGTTESIYDTLEKDIRQRKHDAISISIVSTGDLSEKNPNELEPSFMYSKLLKEILLDLDDSDHGKQQMVEMLREQYGTNASQLTNIDKFEQEYHLHSPIWWYTYLPFTYELLNRASRTLDTDIVLRMGFFLRDVELQIKQIHSRESHDQGTLIVYRGQGMFNEDLKKLRESRNGLLSFNNFLSTSTDRDVSLMFCPIDSPNPDVAPVLFEMTIDSTILEFIFILDTCMHKQKTIQMRYCF